MTEGDRISIAEQLKEFQHSEETGERVHEYLDPGRG